MTNRDNTHPPLDRRDFIKASAAAAVAGSALLATGQAGADVSSDELVHRNERPGRMQYRKLGRTNFMSSRLIFGCAVVTSGTGQRLLEGVYESGINHLDAGSDVYYKGVEKALAPFVKEHRDELWLMSKGPVRAGFDREEKKEISAADARDAAQAWAKLVDDSLEALGCDYMDVYSLMMVDQPALLKTEEIYNAFLETKKAGKVGHFGFTSHKRAAKCLEAATETGWYDVAMIAITPAGWYEQSSKTPPEGAPTLKEIRPLLDRAREAGIGLIGMKGALYVAPRGTRGEYNHTVFDHLYGEKLLAAPFNGFQRSYAYCLENGLDVYNSDMPSFKHLEENVVAAKNSALYLA